MQSGFIVIFFDLFISKTDKKDKLQVIFIIDLKFYLLF